VTTLEARQILLLYRPGTADAEDPEIIEAMALARQDPELAQWFEQHCAFQKAMQAKMRQIEVPVHLKVPLVAGDNIVPLPRRKRLPVWLAAAAVLVALVCLAGLMTRPPAANRYENFQVRMISTAVRPYAMEIVTNDMGELRKSLATRGAPADYELTKGLERLPLTGGGALRWRNNPVSMVCFNRGDNQMIFLFVLNRSALKDPPPAKPQVSKSNDFITVRWSCGDKTYLLAGPEEAGFVEKYL